MCLVSVIIPVFNASRYLHRCIDSILSQTFEGAIEILLVDDGSTDNSGAICDEYAANYSCITVYHTENRGASLARRLGLEKSAGEYVTFVDSDDYVAPNYLSRLFDTEKMCNTGVSACKVVRLLCGEDAHYFPKSTVPIVLEGNPLFLRFFKYEFWGLYGKLYRKNLLLEVPFPEATISEDYFVMAHLLQAVRKMSYIEEDLYFYEQHTGSLSKQEISAKSFEEFTNVNDVYVFTADRMPAYKAYALSNAIETAVKLLVSSNRQSARFVSQRRGLKLFLSHHRWGVITCKPLNRKVALLALFYSSCR